MPAQPDDLPARPDAADQTDRLILATLAELDAESPASGTDAAAGIAVLDDETGALTAAALTSGRRAVLAWCASRGRAEELAAAHPDALADGRLRIAGIGRAPTSLTELVGSAGAPVPIALLRLPKALAALERRAAEAAESGIGTLIGGARVKHMTRTQNEVLGRRYEAVHATRGLGKSRCLVARAPRPAEALGAAEGTARLTVRGQRRELALRGVGGVFGGASADAGSMLLLGALDDAVTQDPDTFAPVGRAVDLGCGNGLMVAYLADAFPDANVLASDDDLDAVASTRATLLASGLDSDRIEVAWETSLGGQPDASADLVLLNPPFHDGPAIDATLVHGLLDAASRVLRPGGQLWFVHNSHLRYRREVERRVGPTDQRARDRRFTVLRARRTTS